MIDGVDEKVGMDVIKDSMGLSDEDLAPETGGEFGDDLGDALDRGGDDLPSDRGRPDDRDSGELQDRTPPQPTQQRDAQRPDPLRQRSLQFDPRADFRQDKKGNLVDVRTGEVIARAGSEARIYQRIHKQASDYIKGASQRIQGMVGAEREKLNRAVEIGLGFERELGQLKGQMAKLNAYELNQDQLLEAAQYFKQAQTDPVGVLKNLLTRAALSGIDIQQLGFDSQNLDAKSILDMVRKEISQGVKPVQDLTAQQTQERRDQEMKAHYLNEARGQVETFFRDTPAAVPFTHIFHAVLSQPQFRTMSLGAIWDKLQLHLMRQGIDPNNPSRQQRQRVQPTRGAPSRSMPNGQGMAPGGSDSGRRQQNAGVAHPSKSYDAIIREILQEQR